MKNFKGRTAVVTGAASGIGRELAVCCAKLGMQLVLADVDDTGMCETISTLPAGTRVIRQRTDVSNPESVESLAVLAFDTFGEVGLLFNNAGVAIGGLCWETTPQDWQWVLGVNLMGVANGIRSFVPRLLAQESEAHIVNTSSAAGLISVAGAGIYCATKHAVVTLSECLHHELQMKHASIGVSVLCPSFVETGIADSERSRPIALRRDDVTLPKDESLIRRGLKSAKLSATEIAEITLTAVRKGDFYILPHDGVLVGVKARFEGIAQGSKPSQGVLPSDWYKDKVSA